MAISNINAFMMHAIADERANFTGIQAGSNPIRTTERSGSTILAEALCRWLASWGRPASPRNPADRLEKVEARVGQSLEAPSSKGSSFRRRARGKRKACCCWSRPEPGLLIETADQFLRAFDGSSRFAGQSGLNFDIVATRIAVSDDSRHDDSKAGGFPTFATFTWKTLPPRGPSIISCQAEGRVDFACNLLRAIKTIQYKGWITILSCSPMWMILIRQPPPR